MYRILSDSGWGRIWWRRYLRMWNENQDIVEGVFWKDHEAVNWTALQLGYGQWHNRTHQVLICLSQIMTQPELYTQVVLCCVSKSFLHLLRIISRKQNKIYMKQKIIIRMIWKTHYVNTDLYSILKYIYDCRNENNNLIKCFVVKCSSEIILSDIKHIQSTFEIIFWR